MQNMNQRTSRQIRRLQQKRACDRVFLVFTEELVHYQAERKRAVGTENPQDSRAWQEDPFKSAFERPDMSQAVCHICMFGKRRPDTRLLVQKPTMVKGSPEVCEAVNLKCNKKHLHSRVSGVMRFKGRTIDVSEWAGGYTEKSAKKLLAGAEKFLRKQGWTPEIVLSPRAETRAIFSEGARETSTKKSSGKPRPQTVSEDTFMPAQERSDEWSAQEVPEKFREEVLKRIPRAIRREVRRMHHGLGHPKRTTFLRMLRLGGATAPSMEYAKIWQCPVCAEIESPLQPMVAAPTIRPFGFNKIIGLDLKYLKDAETNHHVALSIVCFGTAFHGGTMLKKPHLGACDRTVFRCMDCSIRSPRNGTRRPRRGIPRGACGGSRTIPNRHNSCRFSRPLVTWCGRTPRSYPRHYVAGCSTTAWYCRTQRCETVLQQLFANQKRNHDAKRHDA